MKKALGVVFILVFCVWLGVRVVASIQFDRGCKGYLKRAADANTVELAKKQLKIALDYIEREGLIVGYTSVLYRTPDEDVGFWYANVKSSFAELEQVDPNATQLEKSNLLMKLRETLLDQGDQGKTKATVPDGISVFPSNAIVALLGFLGFILLIIGILLLIIFWDE